jgi:hypothetical protein
MGSSKRRAFCLSGIAGIEHLNQTCGQMPRFRSGVPSAPCCLFGAGCEDPWSPGCHDNGRPTAKPPQRDRPGLFLPFEIKWVGSPSVLSTAKDSGLFDCVVVMWSVHYFVASE